MPPTLLFCNTESLGERIQAAFPDARVVKSLNTTNAQLMVDPRQLTEPTTMFVSGNDQDAKDWVRRELLERWFGWEQRDGPRRHHLCTRAGDVVAPVAEVDGGRRDAPPSICGSWPLPEPEAEP